MLIKSFKTQGQSTEHLWGHFIIVALKIENIDKYLHIYSKNNMEL